jgi:hypothetical protein
MYSSFNVPSKNSSSVTSISIIEPQNILDNLEDLRNHKTGINWVRIGYEKNGSLKLQETGKNGIEELKNYIKQNEICFAVVEVVVKGDDYNPVKFMLVTWIGSLVPPGLMKAKSGAHRKDLMDFIQTKIAIAGEYQPLTLDDFNPVSIADKLTRVAKHEVSNADEKKHQMSRPDVNQGNRTKSKAQFDSNEIKDGLLKVYKGEARWSALSYVGKDQIGYLLSGNDLESLKSNFPNDKIIYSVVSQIVKETTNTVTKFLLVTMVGENAGPLAKAKSGAHRAEVADYVKSIMPFHSFYQASTSEDLNEDLFKEKLRT